LYRPCMQLVEYPLERNLDHFLLAIHIQRIHKRQHLPVRCA